MAAATGNPEALAMLARALGELARTEDAPEAASTFQRALELHREIELPHDRAELLVSASAAAGDAGLEDQAREWLADARLQARGSARGHYRPPPSVAWPNSAAPVRARPPPLVSRPGNCR